MPNFLKANWRVTDCDLKPLSETESDDAFREFMRNTCRPNPLGTEAFAGYGRLAQALNAA